MSEQPPSKKARNDEFDDGSVLSESLDNAPVVDENLAADSMLATSSQELDLMAEQTDNQQHASVGEYDDAKHDNGGDEVANENDEPSSSELHLLMGDHSSAQVSRSNHELMHKSSRGLDGNAMMPSTSPSSGPGSASGNVSGPIAISGAGSKDFNANAAVSLHATLLETQVAESLANRLEPQSSVTGNVFPVGLSSLSSVTPSVASGMPPSSNAHTYSQSSVPPSLSSTGGSLVTSSMVGLDSFSAAPSGVYAGSTYTPYPVRSGFPFVDVRITQQPIYSVVIYKQNMSPPYAVSVTLKNKFSESGVSLPYAVQAEIFDENDQLIPNQSMARGGFSPCSHEIVSLKTQDENELTAVFERFRINISGRGKTNYLRFYVVSRCGANGILSASGSNGGGSGMNTGGSGNSSVMNMGSGMVGKECIGVSERIRLTVSSQANHQRDFIAKRLWETLSSAHPTAFKATLPALEILRAVQEVWRQSVGRPMSDAELLNLYRYACSTRRDGDPLLTDDAATFALFRDGVWRIAFEAEKILRHDPRLLELWRKGLLHAFAPRTDADRLLAHRTPGTFMIRFSEADPGVILAAALTLSPIAPSAASGSTSVPGPASTSAPNSTSASAPASSNPQSSQDPSSNPSSASANSSANVAPAAQQTMVTTPNYVVRHYKIPREQVDRGHLFDIIQEQHEWLYVLGCQGIVLDKHTAMGHYFTRDIVHYKEDDYEILVRK
eukprot:TRINITY_DN1158_c0_g4_i2.p1 TRINITY_DN1158_c0_g4~~TRINITY_DN1158_c0_g4_i2.p1  ORF type:complete len:724 (-),score=161.88 TRINITY_DN1158_c0_g4_i2:425-2596(-)